MQMQKEAGLYNPSMPVFRFSSGKNLTPSTMNIILGKIWGGGVLDQTRDKITCHSFRAAVASVLNRFPHLASSEDIKGWGRWVLPAILSTPGWTLRRKEPFSTRSRLPLTRAKMFPISPLYSRFFLFCAYVREYTVHYVAC
jgi:hypothetical protein